MNWLQCSNCQRLYVSFGEKLFIPNNPDPIPCRHCEKYGITASLQAALIMPTFLKDLTNFQVKLVWQNAGVELMEAERVVFIGYSLPYADFEFRQLLSRMLHKNAAIDVILLDNGSQYLEERKRYEQFFSGHKLSVEGIGVKTYVSRICGA